MTTQAPEHIEQRTLKSGVVTSVSNFLDSAFSRFGIVFALLVLAAVLTLLSPAFLTVTNLTNVLLQTSINCIVAMGVTFALTAAGTDLSVGSIVGLAGVIVGSVLVRGWGLPAAILVGLAAGALCGCVNGILIAQFKLPAFVATLSTMSALRGLAMIYAKGMPIYGIKPREALVIAGRIGGIPKPILIAGGAALVAYFLFNHTKFGEYTIAVGGNEEAAVQSGINVKLVRIAIWTFCGLMAGLASIVLTCRLYAAEPMAGDGYQLDAIAAAVLGGTSFGGGEGSILGTVFGAIFTSLIRNGLNLLNVQSYYQQLVIGALIIAALVMDKLRKQ